MRTLAFLLLSLCAGCEYVYAVRRSTPIDQSLDAPAVEQLIRRQPGYSSVGPVPLHGQSMAHAVDRGIASAFVFLAEGELVVESFRIGPPDDDQLDAWLQLQSELIIVLREQFPFLPPESSWQLTNSYLDAQLAAAADRAARGS